MPKRKLSMKKLCIVGIFPPPHNGMSAFNQYIKNYFSDQHNLLVIDYSPRRYSRSFFVSALKIVPVLLGSVTFFGSVIKIKAGQLFI